MTGVFTIVSLVVSVVSVVLAYIWHIDSNRPSSDEVSDALHRRFVVGSDQLLQGDHHVVNVVKATATDTDSWLEMYDNPEQERVYAWLSGLFVGSAELVLYFEHPKEPPSIEQIESHPNYGEGIMFSGSDASIGSYEVTISGRSMILKVDFYTDSVERGAALVVGATILVSELLDDILSGQLDDDPDGIQSVDEVFSGERLNDVDPVTKLENRSVSVSISVEKN